MNKPLSVLLQGRRIGMLTQTGRTYFTYDPKYAATAGAIPLSLAMPLNVSRHSEKTTMPWIDGVLPDSEEVRRRWADEFGVSTHNPYALLSHMGKDCPGAVQFAVAEDEAAALADEGELIPISEQEIGERLRTLRQQPNQWSMRTERWSLGGAQSKFALRWEDGWHQATGAQATTHIIKPGISWLAEQSLNEHICLTAAGLLGLPVAKSEYLEFAGEPCIVVTRYDRQVGIHGIRRLHQEDACQALSVLPARKYELDGGPGLAAISDLLQIRCDADSVWRFAQAQAFGYLIGATDGHAKNYSILLQGSTAALAPLYDIASVLPYDIADDGIPRRVAISIAGERRFGQVTHHHWAAMATRCHVNPDRLLTEIVRLRNDLPDAVSTAIAATPGAANTELATRFGSRLVEHLHR